VRELNCVNCGTSLEPAVPADVATHFQSVNQPYGGTTFVSHGHYGSTVFDEMSKYTYLELNFCDPCLVAKAREGLIYHVKETPVSPERSYEPWVPPEIGEDDE
jgi:hypothetical protein